MLEGRFIDLRLIAFWLTKHIPAFSQSSDFILDLGIKRLVPPPKEGNVK
jgi:hypothetical protein